MKTMINSELNKYVAYTSTFAIYYLLVLVFNFLLFNSPPWIAMTIILPSIIISIILAIKVFIKYYRIYKSTRDKWREANPTSNDINILKKKSNKDSLIGGVIVIIAGFSFIPSLLLFGLSSPIYPIFASISYIIGFYKIGRGMIMHSKSKVYEKLMKVHDITGEKATRMENTIEKQVNRKSLLEPSARKNFMLWIGSFGICFGTIPIAFSMVAFNIYFFLIVAFVGAGLFLLSQLISLRNLSEYIYLENSILEKTLLLRRWKEKN